MKFGVGGTHEYQRVRVQEQWGLSGLISTIRLGLAAWPGVRGIFSGVHPPQVNNVGSGVV